MTPSLRIDNLWKCYAAGVSGCSARTWVLRGCSFVVRAGECVAIAGRPAAGKSTLLQCIAGLRSADGGRVHSDFASVVYLAGPAPVGVRRRENTLYLLDGTAGLGERDLRNALDHDFHGSSALIIATRHVAPIASLVQRVYALRDGRLDMMPRTPVRRVAERTSTILTTMSCDTHGSSDPGTGLA